MIHQATDLEVTVYDHDLVGKDDICGLAKIPLANLSQVLSDMQQHDIWVDLQPQGKLLLRLQLDSNAAGGNGDLADIEFYFRKSFREMKRCTGDILTVMAEGVSGVLLKELVKIVRETEKRGKQGLGDTSFKLKSIFSAPESERTNHENDKTAKIMLVTTSEVEEAVEPLTEYLNDTLSTLTSFLYPRLAKELLRKAWKEILVAMESVLVPSLFGDSVLIPALGRTKPLTERQVEMLGRVLDVLKGFFHADGNLYQDDFVKNNTEVRMSWTWIYRLIL
jgi:hypothetical protein